MFMINIYLPIMFMINISPYKVLFDKAACSLLYNRTVGIRLKKVCF